MGVHFTNLGNMLRLNKASKIKLSIKDIGDKKTVARSSQHDICTTAKFNSQVLSFQSNGFVCFMKGPTENNIRSLGILGGMPLKVYAFYPINNHTIKQFESTPLEKAKKTAHDTVTMRSKCATIWCTHSNTSSCRSRHGSNVAK